MMAEHIDGGKETISKFATVKRRTWSSSGPEDQANGLLGIYC